MKEVGLLPAAATLGELIPTEQTKSSKAETPLTHGR